MMRLRWLGVVGVFGMVSLVGRARAATEAGGAWGEASDGIRCRLVAISPSTDDEAPDLSRAVESCATCEDVTLGVELQNVGDKPVTLLGRSRDEGRDDKGSGEPGMKYLGPKLFEMEISTDGGKPLPGTARRLLGSRLLLFHDASEHVLAPGESMVVSLRPARFVTPMSYQLPAGTYAVRVRYHGYDDDPYLPKMRQAKAGRPVEPIWTGTATSNEVSFTVAGGADLAPSDLHWGDAVNGLRAAVTLRGENRGDAPVDDPASVESEKTVDVTLHIQNVSDAPISFWTEAYPSDSLSADVVHSKIVGSWWATGARATTGWPTLFEWTLQPNETAKIVLTKTTLFADFPFPKGVHTISLQPSPVQRGSYDVRYTIGFANMAIDDRRTPWHGELVTGGTPLVVR